MIFLSYSSGSGYAAGEQAPAAALDCTLRNGHTAEEKADLLTQVWEMFQRHTGIATNHLRNITPGNPVNQCDGDGTDHAPCGPGFQ